MSRLVENILKEATGERLNELWGLSKEERDAKQAKAMKLEQIKVAKLEVKDFDPKRLIGQAGSKAKGAHPDNDDILGVIKPRIYDAGLQMPNFKKLFPKIFELKPNSTNAASINYKGWQNTYLPTQFWFAVENHQVSKQVFDQRAFRMLDELEAELNKK